MTTNAAKTQWQYLEKRPDSWRQQLYLKGRKLRAYTVWSDMLVNGDTILEAADNWDLPLGAIEEVIRYCQTHQSLLQQEAEEEGHYLEERGVVLEPTVTHR
ncbi:MULTISPECIES: hypothetical protein, partial [Microcystis]|jgi:hypothetical protein|uniref:hypothetical protein n=1 Tax=Microcystis TaxID=1125 RepID=UPI0008FFB744